MTKEPFNPTSLKSLAGSVLLGPGLFVLCGHLACIAAAWNAWLGRDSDDGLGVLSSVIWASSIREQQLVHLLVHLLWPVVLVAIGGVLLRTETE
jgi:uncharacterized membrane protein